MAIELSRLKNLLSRGSSAAKTVGGRAQQHFSWQKVGAGISEYGVSAATSSALAVAHAMLEHGLDFRVNSKTTVPLDAASATALGIGSLMMGDTASAMARHAGASALSVYTFRKTFSFVAAKRLASGKMVGGQIAGESGFFGENALSAQKETQILAALQAIEKD